MRLLISYLIYQMMKPKYITCNYTNLYGTKLNGRLNRDQGYMYSLRSIAEVGDSIINYTCPYNMSFVDPFLAQHNITNVINVDYDLTKSPYHAAVDSIKDEKPFYYTDTSWLNRCVEIMWGKFLWLEDNLTKLEDDDYLFWIDAGLSQGAVIPRKFNPFQNNKQYYKEDGSDLLLEYCFRHDTIFNKEFTRRLETYTGEKILTICIMHQQHGDSLGFSFFNALHRWPIGGLFGGKKKYMLPFIQEFKRYADIVLANKMLVKEEQIMAVIYNERPEWFKSFAFETWYHENWEVFHQYNPPMVSFSDFFTELVCVN